MYRQRLYRLVLLQLLVAGLLIPAAVAVAAGPVSGTVDSDLGLNFRVGPGLTYRVQLVLKDGQALELLGRSANNQWLEARLPDSGLPALVPSEARVGGWVFAAYVDTNADLSALPVTEAVGGPTDERPPAAQAYPLYVSIVDNVATVYLQKYPANAEVVIKLGRPGSSADLRVAQDTTDANGVAQITFAMPARWADGKAVVERNLVLVAITSDEALSHSASIVYIR